MRRPSRRFIPALEVLEARLVLNSAPVAVADSFGVFGSQALVSRAGLLQNDTDADGDLLTVVAINGTAANVGQQITLASGSTVKVADDGTFTYTAATSFSGTDYFSYTMSDGTASSTGSADFTVSSELVSFPVIADRTSKDGDAVSYTVPAADLGGHSLTFAAVGLPDGLTINPSTGAISGTIPAGATTYGDPSRVTVTVSDGTNSASREFLWQVDTRVTVSQLADRSNIEGDSISLQASASIPGGATLTHSAFELPAGLSINANTGLITGTILPGAAQPNEPYMTTVTATDGTYFGAMTFQWSVGQRVTVAAISDQQGTEGASVSLQTSASIPGSGTLSFSAQDLPNGLSINAATGLITGTLGPNAHLHEIPALVTVSATNGTFTGTRRFFWAITPRVTITAIADTEDIEGNAVSFQVSASSPGGTLAYSATGLPPGMSINATTGLVSGTISPQPDPYYDAVVTVSDGTYGAFRRFTWNVTPRVTFTAIADRQGNEGDTVSFQAQASVAGGGTVAYSATGLPAGLGINASTGLITGTLASPPFDPLPVTITATSGAYTGSMTFNWAVASRISLAAVADQNGSEGDGVSIQISASVAGGGTLAYSATGLPAGLSINTSTGLITGTINAGVANDAAYLAEVVATSGASSACLQFFWAVSPRVDLAYIADQASAQGVPVSLAVLASIPGGVTLGYTATGLPAGLSINSATGVISGTPANATAGNPLAVTVTASGGGFSASRTFKWTVDSRIVSGGLTARSNSYSGEQGQILAVNGTPWGSPSLLENDSATSGGPLTVTAVNGVAGSVGATITLSSGAKLTVAADGTFAYEGAAGFAGVDTFTYTVANGLFNAVVPVFVKFQPPAILPPNLDDVLYKLFDRIQVNRAVTLDAVNAEILKPMYASADRRAEAAALVVLKLHVLKDGKLGTNFADTFFRNPGETVLERWQLGAFRRRRANPEQFPEKDRSVERVQALNRIFQAKYHMAQVMDARSAKLAPQALIWGNDVTPMARASQVRQGGISNCTFVGALTAYARSAKPEDLKARINPKIGSPGVYIVKLYDSAGVLRHVEVPEPSISQRLLDGNSTTGSLWVTLFERAYVKLRITENRALAGLYYKDPVLVDEVYYQVASKYALMDDAIRSLTGVKTPPVKIFNGTMPPSKADLLRQLVDFDTKPRLLTLMTPTTFSPAAKRIAAKEKLFNLHTYVIVSYNPDTNRIHLKNPFNRDGVGGRDVFLSPDDLMTVFREIAGESWIDP